MFQFCAVNVNATGVTVPSDGALDDRFTMTSASGWLVSTTEYEA